MLIASFRQEMKLETWRDLTFLTAMTQRVIITYDAMRHKGSVQSAGTPSIEVLGEHA
jgi:uncharacterized protein YjaG (DUF416 family)